MYKTRKAMALMMLVALGVFGLYGCGGETPTNTPLPPTVTIAATATTAPATATTVMQLPTATTAMEQPTSMSAQPTTTAGGNTGGGTGGANSGAAMDLLSKSTQAMKNVKSYHLVLKIVAAGTAINAEGDVVLPDKTRLMMDLGPAGQAQVLVIGGHSYTKIPGQDAYVEASTGGSPLGASSNPIGFAEFAESANIIGDEMIDGTDTTHVKFSYDAAKALAMAAAQSGLATPTTVVSIGKADADMWIEKSTGYMRMFKYTLLVSGTDTSTTITLSKFNEEVTPPIEKPTNITTLPGALGGEQSTSPAATAVATP